MKRIIEARYRIIGIFLLITVVAFGALYFRWIQLTPWPGEYATEERDSPADYICGSILLMAYVVLIITLKITKKNGAKAKSLFILIPLCLSINGLYLFFFMPFVEDTVYCNGVTYYLTSYPYSLANDRSYYQLSTWTWNLKSEILFQLPSGLPPVEIVCDKKLNAVRVFGINNHLRYFTDGSESYYYDSGEHITLNQKEYQFAAYDLNGTRKYVITICTGETANTCTVDTIEYSSPSSQDESHSFILDESTDEIYLIFDGKIHSSYTDKTLGFSNLYSVQMGYSIASYQRNNVFSYVLYVCDNPVVGSYAPCQYIPFSYSTPNQENAKITVDKKANILSVYIGEKLIFTKGLDDPWCFDGCLDSQCHIEGCTIPKP